MSKTSKGSVMVVDDCLVTRKILCDMMSSMRYSVVCEATNGAEAVSLYPEHRPDIVLMDLIMPVMDGIDATTAIKSMDPDAFIVAVSSHTQSRYVIGAINAGASDFVMKPFLEERLMEVLLKFDMIQKSAVSGCE